MDKHILEQYCDMQEEAKDLEKRIDKLEKRIRQIKNGEIVADVVSCGKKGKKALKTKRIEGTPVSEYYNNINLLAVYKRKLQTAYEELLEKTNEVEEYIQGIEDGYTRRILRFRHIDRLTWQQVAFAMGKKHTADSCRKIHDRFLKQEIERISKK